MSLVETTKVWRWHKVEAKRGVLVDTSEWWARELERRTAEGWRLVGEQPASVEGCTVYTLTRRTA